MIIDEDYDDESTPDLWDEMTKEPSSANYDEDSVEEDEEESIDWLID